MPQIYRYNSSDRPALSSTSSSDAEEAIVLSDLVRTGEASRLRRRGAMRIDHAARQPLPVAPALFVPSPDNMWASYGDVPVDDDLDNPNSYPGEWIEMRDGQLEDSDYRDDSESKTFLISCGGPQEDQWSEDENTYQVSPLPSYPTPAHSHYKRRHSKKSNGCGAVVHVSAIPRRRCGVWMARDGGTDAVVGMDASYFDRSAVTRMMKSTCGCVREGIGCAVCGNTLGTRYKPCQAAAEGLFSSTTTACDPVHPSGPKYWHCRQNSTHGSKFYVYTFFSDRVSSSPSYKFNQPPAPTPAYQPLTASPMPISSLLLQSSVDVSEVENVRPAPAQPLRSAAQRIEFDMDGDLIIDGSNSADKTTDNVSPGR